MPPILFLLLLRYCSLCVCFFFLSFPFFLSFFFIHNNCLVFFYVFLDGFWVFQVRLFIYRCLLILLPLKKISLSIPLSLSSPFVFFLFSAEERYYPIVSSLFSSPPPPFLSPSFPSRPFPHQPLLRQPSLSCIQPTTPLTACSGMRVQQAHSSRHLVIGTCKIGASLALTSPLLGGARGHHTNRSLNQGDRRGFRVEGEGVGGGAIRGVVGWGVTIMGRHGIKAISKVEGNHRCSVRLLSWDDFRWTCLEGDQHESRKKKKKKSHLGIRRNDSVSFRQDY